MFAVVYSGPALAPALFDPDVGINFATMVHGGQDFEWGEPACSGDEITTTPSASRSTRKTARASTSSSPSPSTRTATEVVRGVWTNIVRGV